MNSTSCELLGRRPSIDLYMKGKEDRYRKEGGDKHCSESVMSVMPLRRLSAKSEPSGSLFPCLRRYSPGDLDAMHMVIISGTHLRVLTSAIQRRVLAYFHIIPSGVLLPYEPLRSLHLRLLTREHSRIGSIHILQLAMSIAAGESGSDVIHSDRTPAARPHDRGSRETIPRIWQGAASHPSQSI